MSLIKEFDPWHFKLCTCKPKLTFNPYTGCDHSCVYCYASNYIPNFFHCRPKKNLASKLEREATKLKGALISIANSSDPYPNLEGKLGLMRKCLEILSRQNCRVQIVTKSNLVVRDIDLLKKIPSMISLTITTERDDVARLIEPHAPSPSERLSAAEILVEKNIPISVRIDPIIPFLNDNTKKLVEILASISVKHITASTYKVKPDNWQRFSICMPKTAEKLKPLYFAEGEKIGRYIYLPKNLRLKLLHSVAIQAKKYGIRFGTCREGLAHLNTATCDGSWLIREETA